MKNKATKLISGILIVSMLLPGILLAIPNHASAQTEVVSVPTSDTQEHAVSWLHKGLTWTQLGINIKQWAQKLLELMLMSLARAVLARITQSTINWINSDFHGSPLWLENPGSFFTDIAKSQVKTMVDAFGYDALLYPYGRDYALSVINAYQSTLQSNAAYTLGNVMRDATYANSFRTNFNVGGWNAFFINTQYPQNNYVGFQTIAYNQLAAQLQGVVQAPAQKIQSLLQQGMGFLSPQSCPSNPAYNNGYNEFNRPSFDEAAYRQSHPYPECADDANCTAFELQEQQNWTASYNAAKSDWAQSNTCPGGLQNTTPGSVAANQIMTAMSSDFRQTELGAALGNSLAAIFDALINHFLNKGLNSLAGSLSPSSPPDNWTYNGQSLGGGGGHTSPGTLDVPQNVSVTIGETTSTEISGGQYPYSIEISPDSSVATAEISGTTLSVTGVASGSTSMVVADASSPAQTVTIQITVNAPGALAITPASITTSPGSAVTATVTGGTPPYSISSGPDEGIAIVTLSDSALVVSGVAVGTTSFTISDSSTSPETVTVGVTVSDSTALGSCTLGGGEVMQNISESDCDSAGGTWTAYDSTTQDPTVNLSSNKSSIDSGQHAILSWSSVGATSCSATWTTSTSASGSETVSPTSTTTYDITCANDSGRTGTDSVTVNVGPGL